MKLILLALVLLLPSCSTIKNALSPARDVSAGNDGFDEAAVRLFDPKLTP